MRREISISANSGACKEFSTSLPSIDFSCIAAEGSVDDVFGTYLGQDGAEMISNEDSRGLRNVETDSIQGWTEDGATFFYQLSR